MEVIRKPTNEDRTYVGDDGEKISKFLGVDADPSRSFEEELGKQIQKAIKEKLPFAERVAREDYKQFNKSQIDSQLQEYGKIKYPEKIKKPKTDWTKYKNINNFEIVEEGERFDEHLSKINPGLHVSMKFTRYKFKGYSNTYTVMEDKESALTRSQNKRDKVKKN